MEIMSEKRRYNCFLHKPFDKPSLYLLKLPNSWLLTNRESYVIIEKILFKIKKYRNKLISEANNYGTVLRSIAHLQ